MGREVDRRDQTIQRDTTDRKNALRKLASEASDRLPGEHRLRITKFDPTTGNPAVIASESASTEPGNYIARALEHVGQISRALGLEATQPAEFAPDPHIHTTSSGAVAIHLHQRYKSIPIFQAAETVRFSPRGALTETVGRSVTVDQDIPVEPTLSVEEAVRVAAEHIAVPGEDEHGQTDQFGEKLVPPIVDLAGFEPRVVTADRDRPDQPTTLEPGPFAEKLKANLIWFATGDDLRLCWEVVATMPSFTGQYRTLVDAGTGEILYCRQLIRTVAARGNVFHVDGAGPRRMTDFPRPLTDYGIAVPQDLPAGFAHDWVEVDESLGNNTHAHLGDNGPPIRGTVQNGIVVFDPADPKGDDQKVLNIFYYNAYMHDFFYLLGFREAQGNFQRDNFGLGGSPSDRVDARAHSGAVFGTANMGTPRDGLSPVMNMGLVTRTGRHTAFDSSVVFHEFMHGVTNRLVGGRMDVHALDSPQSSGMGEGWGDYIACTINESVVVGAWVVDDPAGIRGFRYDSSFPDNFGDIGTGRYTEEHNIGEIWCATLLELNRRIGRDLGVQLVVDALMLSPTNPSFLDMRDSILAALDNKLAGGQISSTAHGTARKGIWAVFAKFGMGPNASSNGASLSGIVADFEPPPEHDDESRVTAETTPGRTIPDNDTSGIESRLTIANSGRVTRLIVSVDIEHTFIGDLLVSLTTPGGRTILLHNRAGGHADNLAKSYDSDSLAALAAAIGDQVQGDWTLRVSDRAGLDVGTLRRWALDISIEAGSQVVRKEASPGLEIPDDDPNGIASSVSVAESGTVRGLTVGVDITHTFIGDLRVEFAAPSGDRAVLHNRGGGSTDNLITTYDSIATPALAVLAGASAAGDWELRVTDLAGRDVGKLNHWSLELML